jgi:hypothetical protein
MEGVHANNCAVKWPANAVTAMAMK